jgi:hypothetical protein
MLLPRAHSLAPIQNEYNCIMLQGNMVDDIYFQGKGAGSHATGSAVVADIAAAVQNKAKGTSFRRSMDRPKAVLGDYGQLARTYLVRTSGPVKKADWEPVKEADGIYAYFVRKVRKAELLEQTADAEAQGCAVMNCLAMEDKKEC